MNQSNKNNKDRELEIFQRALEFEAANERMIYVEGACGNDVKLRRRVDDLITRHFNSTSFLSQTTEESNRTVLDLSHVTEDYGSQIGRYKLLEKLGEGGFGSVWAAEQKEPVRRRVALKIIKLGMDTKQVVARFEAERQALAMMDHHNIAKVLDAGSTDTGRPYFVMELVKGIPITGYCEQEKLDTHARLDLFIKVCHAIQHAHQKGIIHRDIKPSNVMVTLNDGVPVPKVIDFGIAKATQQELTEKTIYTQYSQFIGTPAYISPEQAEMSGLDIDTRTDIYSLGVLLYELLTGTTPFDARELMNSGLDEMRKIIREHEPARPSTKLSGALDGADLDNFKPKDPKTAEVRASSRRLAQDIKGDLDWIVMKCLEKDRSRRYDTANAISMDIQRHLDNEPVVARPPSTTYRMQRFFRRNRLAFSAGATLAVILVVAAVLSSLGFIQARQQMDRAVRSEGEARAFAAEAGLQRNRAVEQKRLAEIQSEELRRTLYVANIARAAMVFDTGNLEAFRTLLDACPVDLRHWEWARLDWLASSATELRLNGWEIPLFTPDGLQILALGALDNPGVVKVWDARTGDLIRTFGQQEQLQLRSNALSPDGRRIVVGDFNGGLRLWDVDSGEMQWIVPKAHANRTDGLAFSPDGKTIASAGWSGDLKVWNAADGKLMAERHLGPSTRGVSFSPKGDRLVTALNATEDVTKVWDVATLNEVISLHGGGNRTASISFSPDSRWIAGGGDDGKVAVWSATTGDLVWSRQGHSGKVYSVAFHPDSGLIASGGEDSVVRLWETSSGADRGSFREHKRQEIWWLNFSPDGQRIGSYGGDEGIRIWKVADVHPDVLTLWGEDGELLPGGDPLRFGFDRTFRSIGFSPDGRQLATVDSSGLLKFWDSRSGMETEGLKNDAGPIACLAYEPTGRFLATGGEDGLVHLYNLATGEPAQTLRKSKDKPEELAFSPDGSSLMSRSARPAVHIWDLHTGKIRHTLDGHEGSVTCMSWSPDGKWVVTGSDDHTLTVWGASTGQLLLTIRGHSASIKGLAVSPNGKLIASGGTAEIIRIWNSITGEEMGSLAGHSAPIRSLAFSPDGQRLFSAGDDESIKVWNTVTMEEMLTLRGHQGAVTSVVVSPDGRMIGSTSPDGSVKIWNSNLRFPAGQ